MKNSFLRILFISFSILINIYCENTAEQKTLEDLAGKGLFKTRSDEHFIRLKLQLEDSEKFISFVDYTNNKYTDIITYKPINEINTEFSVYKYDNNKYIFEKKTLFTLNHSKNFYIKNVMVNSFIPNQGIAFIISLKNESEYEHWIVYEKEQKYIQKSLGINSYMVAADINGDRKIELIYQDTQDYNRKVLKFENSYENFTREEFAIYVPGNSNIGADNNLFLSSNISDKYGNAFVDLNGDCFPDLILTHEEGNGIIKVEIYYALNESYSDKNSRTYNLNYFDLNSTNYGAFVIGDFNRDSQLDFLFPHLNSTKITIFYNIFESKHEWDENYCQKIQEKSSNTLFNNSNYQQITMDLLENNGSSKFYGNNTLIRIGDFDSSGFPSILSTIIEGNNKTVKLFAWEQDKKKYSEFNDFSINKLMNENDSSDFEYATFFDFGEDGRLDILIQTKKNIIAIWNNKFVDKFFLKCKLVLGKKVNYNTTEFGNTFRFVVTDNDGNRRDQVVAQLPQTNDMTLPLPFAYTGIDRSNNYIEFLYVTSNSLDKNKNNNYSYYNNDSYTPIIPNTQLIISKNYNDKKEVKWDIELVVTPIENLKILLAVIIIILIVILVVIIVMHYKEVNEDKEQETDKFRAWFA